MGAVSRYPGILASTMRRWPIAAQHFENAIDMHTHMGARPWLAHTQHDYGAMLLARGAHGDAPTALALLTQAIDIAQGLGMKVLLEKAQALKLNAESPASARKRSRSRSRDTARV